MWVSGKDQFLSVFSIFVSISQCHWEGLKKTHSYVINPTKFEFLMDLKTELSSESYQYLLGKVSVATCNKNWLRQKLSIFPEPFFLSRTNWVRSLPRQNWVMWGSPQLVMLVDSCSRGRRWTEAQFGRSPSVKFATCGIKGSITLDLRA